MRRHLTTANPEGLAPHDHAIWCGSSPADLAALAASVFASARRRNDKMLYLAEDPDPSDLFGLDDAAGLVACGALVCERPEHLYPLGDFDVDVLERLVMAALEDALAAGYGGLCVVADNTSLAGHDAASRQRWLAWERRADSLQARHAITGVCYFDRSALDAEHLAAIATLHPVLPESVPGPAFRLFSDGAVLRAVGSLDGWSAPLLARLLDLAPLDAQAIALDEADFVDHRALEAIEARGEAITVAGLRPPLRRVIDVLGLHFSHLRLAFGSATAPGV
ncbi:MAG: MEDS domain-containing protein [Actinomycetota bacterium]|nr:MEDS domain-containing protein [Actinomycetota bacterium]